MSDENILNKSRRSLSMDTGTTHDAERNGAQTPREGSKRRNSRSASKMLGMPYSPGLTELSENVDRMLVRSPASSFPLDGQENTNTLSWSTAHDGGVSRQHRMLCDDSSFPADFRSATPSASIQDQEEYNDLYSESSTRDGFPSQSDTESPQSNTEPCIGMETPQNGYKGAGINHMALQGGLDAPAMRALTKASRKQNIESPDRKKVCMKTSPAIVIPPRQRPEALGAFSESLPNMSHMVTDEVRPSSVRLQSPEFIVGSPPPTLTRSFSVPDYSPSQYLETKKLETFAHECVKDCVSVETVADILGGGKRDLYSRVIVFDCRYNFEFEGGHIKQEAPWLEVYNVPPNDKMIAERILFGFADSDRTNAWRHYEPAHDVCIIFHCEFSKSRGPKLMKFIRERDRDYNYGRYPQVFYPEMYLMKGGYKEFFSLDQNKVLCEPQAYRTMDDTAFRQVLSELQRDCDKQEKGRKSARHTPVGKDDPPLEACYLGAAADASSSSSPHSGASTGAAAASHSIALAGSPPVAPPQW